GRSARRCGDAVDVEDACTTVVGHHAGIRPMPGPVGEHLDALPHGAGKEPAVADWIEADDGALARALLPARARPAVNRVHVGGKQRPIEVSDRPRGGWLADPGGGARPVLAAVDRSPEPSTRACPDRSRIARIDGDPVHLGGRKGKPAIGSIHGWARVQACPGADVDRYRTVRG